MNITSRWDTTKILYASEKQTLRESVIEAVESGADLRGVYLDGAYLGGVYLDGAYLGGAYLRGADLRGAYLGGAYLGGANLRGADLGGADLRDADLRDADLRDADLDGADLGGADLGGADLGGANLRGAYLGGANLRGADLGGADLRNILASVPLIENLDAAILGAIEDSQELGKAGMDMRTWHTCESTHCRAGWAIHLAGKEGYRIEDLYGPAMAGTLIYLKAGATQIPNWTDTDENAIADLRARAGVA